MAGYDACQQHLYFIVQNMMLYVVIILQYGVNSYFCKEYIMTHVYENTWVQGGLRKRLLVASLSLVRRRRFSTVRSVYVTPCLSNDVFQRRERVANLSALIDIAKIKRIKKEKRWEIV